MSDRPILMCAEMVRQTIARRKTQTRRIAKVATAGGWCVEHGGRYYRPCPYYRKPGDRLWVRETHATAVVVAGDDPRIVYRADYPDDPTRDSYWPGKWTPSIFMRRPHSRITLAVTSLRLESLQDITEADAIAEGVGAVVYRGDATPDPTPHRTAYRALWDSINSKPGRRWADNPDVWVVEFEVVTPP